ncbi:MAG: Rrf2 family transcriptional regulator [Finegoldia sp.]|nr:Rrf2 family transcriptional regulator [Finegoldia sp.]
MRLSTRGRYGLQAVCHIAKVTQDGSHISLMDVSKSTGISESYLEQLVRPLKKDCILGSVRGSQGGYYLARPADEITVKDVLVSLEEFFAPTECVLRSDLCSRYSKCPYRLIWENINEKLNESVLNISLSDIVNG